MPLGVAPIEREVKVVKLLADEKTKKHLQSLGITIGAMLMVLSVNGGSVIIKIKDGRLALDKDLAMKILIA